MLIIVHAQNMIVIRVVKYRMISITPYHYLILSSYNTMVMILTITVDIDDNDNFCNDVFTNALIAEKKKSK